MPNVRLTVYLPPDLRREIRVVALDRQQTPGELLAEAWAAWLREQRRNRTIDVGPVTFTKTTNRGNHGQEK